MASETPIWAPNMVILSSAEDFVIFALRAAHKTQNRAQNPKNSNYRYKLLAGSDSAASITPNQTHNMPQLAFIILLYISGESV